jgi:tetratricopeptide (TPR) repeat protein
LLSHEGHAGDSVQAAVSSQLAAVAFPLTGEILSHYRILDGIGGGGMGLVYRAEDIRLGRQVALKFLPEESVKDPAALGRFEREARAASALEHPNICPIYEYGEHEGRPFLVMQLLEGQTLQELLAAPRQEETPLELSRLFDLAIQIVNGLDAAHRQGFIHRDIKPANIFVTREGQAKILDFGLAKLSLEKISGNACKGDLSGDREVYDAPALSVDPRVSRTGAAMGTAGYMSPEQMRGEKLDARTDLFSFGLVMYEMTTGQRAFKGNNFPTLSEAILKQMPTPVRQLNPNLPAGLEDVICKTLEKDREARYQSAANIRTDLERLRRDTEFGRVAVATRADAWKPSPRSIWVRWAVVAGIALLLVGVMVGSLVFYGPKARALTEKDTIVLGDFANTTGDAVFDDTLKQGLAVQLEQSPFLSLISDRRVNETLKLMGRVPGEPLTPDVARQVCQRTSSKVMLIGSIAGLGREYVIGLKAMNCNTGDVLAEAQKQASGKEAVLKALDAGAVSLRSKLGESLNSLQKYGTPVEEATTPSLEALKAYSLARKMGFTKGATAALPFYKRAVQLDPNFAMAYRGLSVVYTNRSEVGRATENARKAYELREKVSEQERFSIEATYYMHATGELEKAVEVYELWQQTYPKDFVPYGNLGVVYGCLGNWEKAMEETREGLRLEPSNQVSYCNLAKDYTALNRLVEAQAVYEQAEEHKLESEFLLLYGYQVFFVKGDAAQMERSLRSALGKSGPEDLLLAGQADTEAWNGNFNSARQLTQRAMDSAQRNDAKEAAALYKTAAALREVESGNRERGRADAKTATKLASNRDVQAVATLAMARAGDTTAEELANELDKTFPLDTLVQRYWLPTIRAAVALQRKDPSRAIELLNVAKSIELSQPTNLTVSLCPVYLRGQAYLMLHNGQAAAAEFQKFVDHRGLVVNFSWGALARLGLARANAVQGNTVAARDAYQVFLTMWKDADPELPILRQAKAEYAKLR